MKVLRLGLDHEAECLCLGTWTFPGLDLASALAVGLTVNTAVDVRGCYRARDEISSEH